MLRRSHDAKLPLRHTFAVYPIIDRRPPADKQFSCPDVKILRQVIRLRKMDVSERQEQEEILDIYKRALDM